MAQTSEQDMTERASQNDPESVQVEAKFDDREIAYLIALAQVYQEKIRVLMNSSVRRFLARPLAFIGRLTGGATKPLQEFTEFVRLADTRAKRICGIHSDVALSRMFAHGATGARPTASEIRLLRHEAAASPLFSLWLEGRHQKAGSSSPANSRKGALSAALSTAARKVRPAPPAGGVLTALGLAREELFRSRVLCSIHCRLVQNARPVVSVILPTRDRADLLKLAVESVLAQLYPHWELWIVDDRSSDATASYCSELTRKDGRINYLRNEGRGVGAARNTGLKRARGEYIAYLDDDNVWLPYYLQVMLPFMAMENADLCYSSMKMIDGDDGTLFRGKPFDLEELKWQNFVDLNVVVHRRELVERAGYFDEKLERTVDWDFIIRTTTIAKVAWAAFVGAVYSDDRTRADRITVAKEYSWRYHVMNRYYVPWVLPTEPATGSASIILTASGGCDELEASLASIFAAQTGERYEVVVVDNGVRGEDLPRLFLWAELFSELKLVHMPDATSPALAANVGAQYAVNDRLVFLRAGTYAEDRWLEGLLAPLADASIGIVQPLVEAPTGGILSAGYVWPSAAAGGFIPELRRFRPTATDGALSGQAVAAVSSECLGIRRSDFFELRGFEPLFSSGLYDIDLCLRLKAKLRKSAAVVGSVIIRCPPNERLPSVEEAERVRERFAEIWEEESRYLRERASPNGQPHDVRVPDDRILRAAGLAIR